MMRMLLVAWLVLVLGPASLAHGQGLRWDIDSLDAVIEVREDGSLNITETIVADFSREAHHGIFREIPYAYERMGTSFRLRIHVVGVADGSGGSRRYRASRDDGRLVLKIGDPDRKVSGAQTYVIHYVVRRGLLGFETHDELYWNAVGRGWAVPIERASCLVRLPGGVDGEDIRAASYLGPFGSAASGPAGEISGDGVLFEPDRALRPRESLTVVVGWPKGIVAAPSGWTRLGWFLRDNLVLVTPVIAFGLLVLLWFKRGRDMGTPGSIMVRYEPPDGLSPAEVGLLADELVHKRDVTATVIDLAVRGYLRIEDRRESRRKRLTNKRMHLVRTDRDRMDLRPHEFRILSKLLPGEVKERSLEDLELKFYTAMPGIKDDLHKSLDAQGYTAGHLGKRRAMWIGVGVACAAGVIALSVLVVKGGLFAPASTIVAGVLTAVQFPIFAFVMPRKTRKGRRALEAIKGLEEYIQRAEVKELEEAARRDRFEKLLPYAMALGLTKVWGEHFAGLFDAPPEWYDYPAGSPFTTHAMISDLFRSNILMSAAMAASPRTSSGSGGSSFGGGGSGFSGGFSGGGGGGGGAW